MIGKIISYTILGSGIICLISMIIWIIITIPNTLLGISVAFGLLAMILVIARAFLIDIGIKL